MCSISAMGCTLLVLFATIPTTCAIQVQTSPDVEYPYVRALVANFAGLQEHGNCSGSDWHYRCSSTNDACELDRFGSGFGQHTLCSNMLQKDACDYIAYGITKDISYHTELKSNFSCNGIVLDARRKYGKFLPGTKIPIRKEAAPMLGRNKFKVKAPAALKRELNLTRLNILKMDCEGCEYALAASILRDEPDFFLDVDQFTVAVHHDFRFMRTARHLAEYDRLLGLLHNAGLKLQDAEFQGCGEVTKDNDPKIVHYPCLKELKETGYQCSVNCVNMLFARA